jgi:hypothetical protein
MFGAHKNCPHCRVRYERETGFYLNAMFVAYAMALVILAPSFLILYLRGVSTFWFSVIMGASSGGTSINCSTRASRQPRPKTPCSPNKRGALLATPAAPL